MLDSLHLSVSARTQMDTAADRYAAHVYQAAGYLEGRGISEHAALACRLGVVSDPLPGHERFEGMLCLPYVTPVGVVALKFRALDPERTPKYDAPVGQHTRLFNVMALHSDSDVIAICEGELDAIVMSHEVGIPAVGIPGASNMQDHWTRVFSDFETVLVIADHDIAKEGKEPPGQRHAQKVAKKIDGARVVLPPPGMDLSDWCMAEGPEAVRKACGV